MPSFGRGRPKLHPPGASAVIWTTTPWTLPGNRALAAGADIDYAVLHVDGVADGSLARVGERLIVALALVPQVCEAVGIALHHLQRVLKGAELEGVLCAHPLRGRGYDPAALREAELEQTARPRRLDTRVEYVDPAPALPAGATARVAVTLAGAAGTLGRPFRGQ